MNVIALIKFPLDVRQPNHDGQVVPNIAWFKLQGFAHERWSPNTSPWCFFTFDTEDSLALKIVEIFSKGSAIGLEIMPLHGQHKERIDFIEGV